MYHDLPEVFVYKGHLAGGEAFPVGLASGVNHQNRVNLKSCALETAGGGCKHLSKSRVTIQLLKDQYVSSKNRFCYLGFAVCVCVLGRIITAHSPLFHLLTPDPLTDLLVPPAASLYLVFDIYWRVKKEPEPQCKHTQAGLIQKNTLSRWKHQFLCLSQIYPDDQRNCWHLYSDIDFMPLILEQ